VEIADFESRWPMKGDRLFVESDTRFDAPIAGDLGERFYRLPMGYKRAGDILLDRAAVDVIDRPNIIYAALFCYRHAIELFLKQFIERFGPGRRSIHDLVALWDEVMVILKAHGADSADGLAEVESLVKEMHDADKKSDGFRYPADATGAPFVFGQQGIDAANLRIVMQGFVNFFECMYADFAHRAG